MIYNIIGFVAFLQLPKGSCTASSINTYITAVIDESCKASLLCSINHIILVHPKQITTAYPSCLVSLLSGVGVAELLANKLLLVQHTSHQPLKSVLPRPHTRLPSHQPQCFPSQTSPSHGSVILKISTVSCAPAKY